MRVQWFAVGVMLGAATEIARGEWWLFPFLLVFILAAWCADEACRYQPGRVCG